MKRRDFLAATCAALLPLETLAQQPKLARVGLLTLGNPEPYWDFLKDGFRDAGYTAGKNIHCGTGELERPDTHSQTGDLQKAAQDVRQQIVFLNASAPAEIEAAFASAAKQGAGALMISNDSFLNGQRERFAALGLRHKIPTMAASRENAEAGGLVSYGINSAASYQQAGVYAGRILKGTKAADLPVLQPARFELAINLKTARALGISVPQALMISADKVIE